MALITYLLMVIGLALLLTAIPDDRAALRGISGMALNGVAGTVALLAAVALRIRSLPPFGFRAASPHWPTIGAAPGLVALGLSLIIEQVYFSFITEPNTQSDFQAAAQASCLWPCWSLPVPC